LKIATFLKKFVKKQPPDLQAAVGDVLESLGILD
jgi:hypothetical protein